MTFFPSCIMFRYSTGQEHEYHQAHPLVIAVGIIEVISKGHTILFVSTGTYHKVLEQPGLHNICGLLRQHSPLGPLLFRCFRGRVKSREWHGGRNGDLWGRTNTHGVGGQCWRRGSRTHGWSNVAHWTLQCLRLCDRSLLGNLCNHQLLSWSHLGLGDIC